MKQPKRKAGVLPEIRQRIIETRFVKASVLKKNPLNFRTHPDDQRRDVEKLLNEIGQVAAFMARLDGDGSLLLLDGHLRTDIADERTVRVDITDLTEEEGRLVLSLFDYTTGMAGIDLAKGQQILASLANSRRDWGTQFDGLEKAMQAMARASSKVTKITEDVVAPPPETPITNRGELWILGNHRLLCGDSTNTADLSRLMNGGSADCVFTSPPYAVGVDYGESYQDSLENLRSTIKALATLWHGVILTGGYAVLNFGDIVSGRDHAETDEPCEYPMALEYWPVFRAAEWTLWSRRVWCKPGAACGSSRHCIGTNRAASNFEHIWTWKRRGKSLVDEQLTGQWPSQAGWFDTSGESKLAVGLATHGAGMPQAVAARCISWHSRIGKIVLEPFCGTGTTLVACEQLQRACYAMEINPAYCDIIISRYEKLTGKKAILQKAA